MIAIISDIDSVIIYGNVSWATQLSRITARASELPQELSLWSEDLYVVTTILGCEHIPYRIKPNTPRISKLSIPTATAAKDTRIGQASFKYLYSVVAVLTNIELVILAVVANAKRMTELQWIATLRASCCNELSIWSELLNTVVRVVSHIDVVITVHSHTQWAIELSICCTFAPK